MSKVIITGGSGFIGLNLSQALSIEHEVINVDIEKPLIEVKHVKWQRCDVMDTNSLKEIFRDTMPEYVVHLAARTDLLGESLNDYQVNTLGTKSVIEATNSVNSVKKVVFASSMLVCAVGHIPKDYTDYCPATIYGESKVVMEKIITSSSLTSQWTIFRPTSIWGPWFKTPYKDFFDMVKKGTFIGISGCANKTYGYVGNTVYQIAKILFDDLERSNKKTFYLGDKPPININLWAGQIAEKLGKTPPYILPKHVVRVAAEAGDIFNRFGIKFPLNTFRYKNMTTDNIMPLGDLYAVVGTPPFSCSEGIDRTLTWMNSY